MLGELDVGDARAAYRAIALANPGGLGIAQAQDVHELPSIGLCAAMALAADRDRIARQYRDGFADLFELALPALPLVFSLSATLPDGTPDAATVAAVQRLYLTLLGAFPDSHIVRNHGESVAHSVMVEAQRWRAASALDADPAFAAWDEALKARRINPGTTADFTVAALLIAGLTASSPAAC